MRSNIFEKHGGTGFGRYLVKKGVLILRKFSS